MKRWNIVLAIASLTILAVTGCTQPPTGEYLAAAGWLGTHALTTNAGGGVMTGTILFDSPPPYFPAACVGVAYTLKGQKDSPDVDADIFYVATMVPETINEECELLSQYCFLLDDSSETGDFSTMAGDICDCTSYPPWVMDCQEIQEGLVYIGPLPEAATP